MAGATVTPHSHPNQDACSVWERADCSGVVVADGLGSLPRSGDASQIAVETVSNLLTAPATSPAEAFATAGHVIATQLQGEGLTTVISVRTVKPNAEVPSIEVPSVEVAWVGNGAVLEICPVAWTSEGTSPPEVTSKLVWTNLVTPHIAYENGRDRLSSVLGGQADPEAGRLVIDVARPTVFFAVSDGLLSFEQIDTGRDESGERWMHLPRPLHGLLSVGAGLLDTSTASAGGDSRSVNATLSELLAELAAGGQLHDDATVAAVILDRPEAVA